MSRAPHVLRRRRKSARKKRHAVQRFVNYMGPKLADSFLESAFQDALFPRLLYRKTTGEEPPL